MKNSFKKYLLKYIIAIILIFSGEIFLGTIFWILGEAYFYFFLTVSIAIGGIAFIGVGIGIACTNYISIINFKEKNAKKPKTNNLH